MSDSEINIDDIVENLLGFSDRIDTPFGEICSLSCDMGQVSRMYKPIEQSIEKIRKHLIQRFSKQTFDGNIITSTQTFSAYTILGFFGITAQSHFLEECNSHDFSPYIAIGKILRINCPTLRGDKNVSNPNILPPRVYVSKYENSYNIIPWKYYGCVIEPIQEQDNLQQISSIQLVEKVLGAVESDLHIISLSAVNSMTGQKILNLPEIIEVILGLRAEMAIKNKNIRIYIALDITQLLQREILNVNQSYLKDIDFFIIQSTKLIGGGIKSSNFLICRSDNQFTSFAPKIPSSQIRFDVLDQLGENRDISNSYRAALQLQFIETLQPQRLATLEKKNVDLFMSQIDKINQELQITNPLLSIKVSGIEEQSTNEENNAIQNQNEQQLQQQENVKQAVTFSHGNLNLSLYNPDSEIFDSKSRQYIHPQFACQILHDLFGIQASCKINVHIQENVLLTNIPPFLSQELGALGSSETISSSVGIDISFLHKENEIQYIVQALKLVCEKGLEMQKFYDKKTFMMNDFSYDKYDLSLLQMQKVFDSREDIVKKRMQKYDAQLDMAKAVFKNSQRYFSLNNGYSKDKTEQFIKKDANGCIPPIISTKSQKADKNNNQKQNIIDEKKVNLLRITIERIELYLNGEIEHFEEEKRKKLEAENAPPAPPPVEEPPSNQPKESEEERQERRRKAIQEAKDELEIKVQAMIADRVLEEQQKEKERMELLMAEMRKEMEEQIKSSTVVKEQFIYEDVQPSVMFKNVLDQREKRYRNLRLIFNNYAKLNQKQNEQQNKNSSNPFSLDHLSLAGNMMNSKEKDGDQIDRVAFTINLQQFILFCSEFSFVNEVVDVNVINQIYSKSIFPTKDKQNNSKEMHFTEFVGSLEKISYVFFAENPLLLTNYDKMEALYQFMQIDDIQKLKKKMMNSSFNYQEARTNPRQSMLKKMNPIYAGSLSELETEIQLGDDLTSYHNKKVSASQDTRISSSLRPQQPRSFQPSQNTSSNGPISFNQVPVSEGNESLFEMKQPIHSANRKINWSDIGGGIKMSPSSGQKNDSKSVGDFSSNSANNHQPHFSSQQQKSQKLPIKSPSSDGQYGNKFQSVSPLKSNIRQSNKSLNFNPPQSSVASLKKNAILERIKEVEDSEMQKQKDLLAFIQQSQQNRYQNIKKKS